MSVMVVNIAKNGRMVLPAEARKALGLDDASQLRVEVTDDGIQITTPRQALMRARERIKNLVPSERSLSTEVIDDRREEIEQERIAE